jgi:hypothetical protein
MEILAPLVVFVLGVLVFGGTVFVVRRFVNLSALQPNNETVPHYLGIVIGIYGIFSGFIIVSLWEQQRQAEDNIVHEASALRSIFRLASAMPEDIGPKIQEHAIAYAEAVIEKEWQLLVHGDPELHHEHPEKDQIWGQLLAYKPDGRESVFFDSLVSHYEDLSDSRRNRCYDALRSLPLYLWIILILGSALSIACTLFIGTENLRTQAALTGISGGLILLMLFVVYDLQSPFRGYWTAKPTAFQQARDRMKDHLQAPIPSKALQVGDGAEVQP